MSAYYKWLNPSKRFLRFAECFLSNSKYDPQHNKKKPNICVLSERAKTIQWIEKLMQTPISDYRKLTLWHIMAPYLLNKLGLSYDESISIMRGWLDKCDKLRKLDFNPNQRIKASLNHSMGFLPISHENLKVENERFYHLLKERGVLTQ